MVLHICMNNLKGFAISRPPLVVFTLCLTALAIATLSLARLVSQADSLRNPDVTLDWNLLLERMAGIDMCVLPEEAGGRVNSSSSSTMPAEGAEEVLVSARMGLAHELRGTLLHNHTLITGTLPPILLGLAGSQSLTVSFRVDSNGTGLPPGNSGGSICASFSGLRSLMPTTRTPPSCTTQGGPGGATARLVVRAQGPQMADDWCEEGTLLRLAYHSNPSLTAVLTLHDRSVVNLHLMHTSYFLLVMAMTLVCYALLRGKPASAIKQGQTTIEKVPLDP